MLNQLRPKRVLLWRVIQNGKKDWHTPWDVDTAPHSNHVSR